MFLSFKAASYLHKLKLKAFEREEDIKMDRLADKIVSRLKEKENIND